VHAHLPHTAAVCLANPCAKPALRYVQLVPARVCECECVCVRVHVCGCVCVCVCVCVPLVNIQGG